MKIILFALSLASALGVFSQTAEEMVVVSDSIEIYGTLLCPEDSDNVPVVLIIAGSGPTDRNGNNAGYINNSLKLLADSLAENGIASLRYDKRGVGASADSTIRESDVRFDDFIDDAILWARLLAEDKRFNQIVVLGHSEGSLIGMLASSSEYVDKYISVAGPGRPANEIILDQIKTSSPFFSIPATSMLDSLADGYTVTPVLPALQGMFRPDVQPYLISWFKYNPAEEIARLEIPVLIIQGSTDIQVPVSEAELLAQADPNAELKVIVGMNHVLKEASADRAANIETYSNPDLPLVDGFTSAIVGFINQN